MDREIADLLNPMGKVIAENNAKIQEEILVRSQLISAERTWIDWWIEASPKMQATFEKLGVRSAAGQATKDVDKLSRNLR
jgi:hypothetical protein